MANIDYKSVLEKIPSLFNINLNEKEGEKLLFEKLSSIIEYNFFGIYFLNPESAILKYSSLNDLKSNEVIKLSKSVKKELFTDCGFVFDKSSNIQKNLNLGFYKSFLIEKLVIGQTVYGFILLASNKENEYNKNSLMVLNSCAKILAYLIKDVELSEVFKLQLKALKDGIVDKNNAYKTIKEQNEKILESEKIKMEFLANVSHELRTPLNAILGFSEILSTGACGELNTKQQEFVSDIRVSGLHLLGMVNEILDMSKIESNTVKLVCTKFFIRGCQYFKTIS